MLEVQYPGCHAQINASFSALNLLKLADREEKGTTGRTVISIASWKRRLSNQHLMCRVFEKLGLPMNDKKSWAFIRNSVAMELSLHESVQSIDKNDNHGLKIHLINLMSRNFQNKKIMNQNASLSTNQNH